MKDFLLEFFKDSKAINYLIYLSPFLFYLFIRDIKNSSEKILKFSSFIINAFWISALIKGILQVPLPNHSNTFAMPSSHVYLKMAIVFATLEIIISKNKTLSYCLSIIFAFIEGLRVIFYGYHSAPDVLVAVFLSFLQALLFYELIFKFKKSYSITLIIAIIMNPVVVFIMKFHAPSYQISGLNKISHLGIIVFSAFYIAKILFSKKR